MEQPSLTDAVRNLSLEDRFARLVLGTGMLTIPVIHLSLGAVASWHGYLLLCSIYPLLTAMVAWDPLYALSRSRSCNTSRRNRCGTLGVAIRAALQPDR